MLPKKNRLTKKKDFDLVFKKGKSLVSDFLTFKILESQSKKPRIGFIVSKKVSKKSTTRNKVKRRLRAAVLNEIGKIKKNMDVIIIASPITEKKEFLEIKKAVNDAFKKLRLI